MIGDVVFCPHYLRATGRFFEAHVVVVHAVAAVKGIVDRHVGHFRHLLVSGGIPDLQACDWAALSIYSFRLAAKIMIDAMTDVQTREI